MLRWIKLYQARCVLLITFFGFSNNSSRDTWLGPLRRTFQTATGWRCISLSMIWPRAFSVPTEVQDLSRALTRFLWFPATVLTVGRDPSLPPVMLYKCHTSWDWQLRHRLWPALWQRRPFCTKWTMVFEKVSKNKDVCPSSSFKNPACKTFFFFWCHKNEMFLWIMLKGPTLWKIHYTNFFFKYVTPFCQWTTQK